MTKPKPPTRAQIVAVRSALKLTQTAAAQLLASSLRAYQAWESGESRMHPVIYRWFSQQAQS